MEGDPCSQVSSAVTLCPRPRKHLSEAGNSSRPEMRPTRHLSVGSLVLEPSATQVNPIHKVSTVIACVVQAEGLGVLLSTGLGKCMLWDEAFYTQRWARQRQLYSGVPSKGNGADPADSIF